MPVLLPASTSSMEVGSGISGLCTRALGKAVTGRNQDSEPRTLGPGNLVVWNAETWEHKVACIYDGYY